MLIHLEKTVHIVLFQMHSVIFQPRKLLAKLPVICLAGILSNDHKLVEINRLRPELFMPDVFSRSREIHCPRTGKWVARKVSGSGGGTENYLKNP
ncbi:hypothetical protein Bxe_B1738 [Paraburkholderia xenovorans LB400]|uniref:Uncharacterized protein n=1 Tax=Paraburkholderia xenovorans (strain LB400) TaxID=266265 RepID=Q13NW1_PARXL|nr:hypothetical protein Bxe_B1738 [Paraburkholderia xenovorans LB400]